MSGAPDTMPVGTMSGTPQLLLAHHLKQLKLPTVLREYDKVARECARDGTDHPRYLLRLIELELIDRERRTIERRIRAARFPAVKSFDTFDFAAIPGLNKMLVLELARCEYVLRRENIIALGNSGTGKTHVALALGLAACQKGFTVTFTTAAALVSQLLEARDERRLLKMQRELAAVKLLIIDELGYVPLSPTGAELLFEVFSQRYERGSTIVTSNLPFEDWTQVLGSERLTGALLDRLTHHVSILTMNGDSYRLKQSAGRRRSAARAEQNQATEIIDPKPARSPPPDRRRQRYEEGPDRGPLHIVMPASTMACFYSAPLAWNPTDFRTIADFRRVNRAAFKPLFRAFVLLCRKLDLFGRELVAVDGTRLKAVNSRKRNFTQQKLAGWIKLADERIEEYLGRLDRADRAEMEAQGAARRAATLEAKLARVRKRRELHQAMLAELVASGESQLSLTDPDARGMAMHPKVGVGYNAQVAIDARHKLIVEQNVTNSGSDLGFLAQTAGAAREVLGVERIDAVADKGYYKGEDIAACEDIGVVPYVARPQRGSAVASGYFNRTEFRYDPEADCYVCPSGDRLDPYTRTRKDEHISIRYTNMRACQTCSLKPQCTSGSRRTIDRWENEAVLERMAERLVARPDILDKRRETVEHPFGSIKQWMNQGAFLMRGLANVNAEFSLTALAYNLRRAINILGIPALLRAVQA